MLLAKLLEYKGYSIPIYDLRNFESKFSPNLSKQVSDLKEKHKSNYCYMQSISTYTDLRENYVAFENMLEDIIKESKKYVDEYEKCSKVIAGKGQGGGCAYIPAFCYLSNFGASVYGLESSSITYDSMEYIKRYY